MPFSFKPNASDPDGDTLTFSATNLPSWASINSSNGTITGTPRLADVGTYSNIRVTVSDGTASVTSASWSIEVVEVGSGTALLSWSAPTQNTDGSALTDLDGYRVYWGPSPGKYTRSANVSAGVTSFLVEGLTIGTWYFAATAINGSAVESSFSNVASKTIVP